MNEAQAPGGEFMYDPSRVEEVPLEAVEKGTPVARGAFLDSACKGDADLQRHVERLLNAHPKVGSFLEPKPASTEAYHPQGIELVRSSPGGTSCSSGSAKAAWARFGSPISSSRFGVASPSSSSNPEWTNCRRWGDSRPSARHSRSWIVPISPRSLMPGSRPTNARISSWN